MVVSPFHVGFLYCTVYMVMVQATKLHRLNRHTDTSSFPSPYSSPSSNATSSSNVSSSSSVQMDDFALSPISTHTHRSTTTSEYYDIGVLRHAHSDGHHEESEGKEMSHTNADGHHEERQIHWLSLEAVLKRARLNTNSNSNSDPRQYNEHNDSVALSLSLSLKQEFSSFLTDLEEECRSISDRSDFGVAHYSPKPFLPKKAASLTKWLNSQLSSCATFRSWRRENCPEEPRPGFRDSLTSGSAIRQAYREQYGDLEMQVDGENPLAISFMQRYTLNANILNEPELDPVLQSTNYTSDPDARNTDRRPIAIFVLGPSASGKTTVTRKFLKRYVAESFSPIQQNTEAFYSADGGIIRDSSCAWRDLLLFRDFLARKTDGFVFDLFGILRKPISRFKKAVFKLWSGGGKKNNKEDSNNTGRIENDPKNLPQKNLLLVETYSSCLNTNPLTNHVVQAGFPVLPGSKCDFPTTLKTLLDNNYRIGAIIINVAAERALKSGEARELSEGKQYVIGGKGHRHRTILSWETGTVGSANVVRHIASLGALGREEGAHANENVIGKYALVVSNNYDMEEVGCEWQESASPVNLSTASVISTVASPEMRLWLPLSNHKSSTTSQRTPAFSAPHITFHQAWADHGYNFLHNPWKKDNNQNHNKCHAAHYSCLGSWRQSLQNSESHGATIGLTDATIGVAQGVAQGCWGENDL